MAEILKKNSLTKQMFHPARAIMLGTCQTGYMQANTDLSILVGYDLVIVESLFVREILGGVDITFDYDQKPYLISYMGSYLVLWGALNH